LAGFEVTLYGRFWVTPEVKPPDRAPTLWRVIADSNLPLR
jgi:hypothetical protein